MYGSYSSTRTVRFGPNWRHDARCHISREILSRWSHPVIACSLLNLTLHTHHPFFNTAMIPRPLLTLVTLLLLPLTLAQFGNFFQGGFPFGGGHFQGNQQDAPKSPGRQHKGWTEMESGEWGGSRHTHDATSLGQSFLRQLSLSTPFGRGSSREASMALQVAPSPPLERWWDGDGTCWHDPALDQS
jgi:hypothetical protein